MPVGLLLAVGIIAGLVLDWWAVPLVVPMILLTRVVRRWPVFAGLVLAVGGIVLGHQLAPPTRMVDACPPLGESSQAMVRVASIPVAGGSFERVLVNVTDVVGDDFAWRPCGGRVLVFLAEGVGSLSVGDRLYVRWDVDPAWQLPPGYGGFVASQGAIGSGRLYYADVRQPGPWALAQIAEARRFVSRALDRALSGDVAALASGFVTGDDSALSDDAEAAFQITGTSHITAVSGQNVTLLIGFVGGWLRPRSRWAKRLVTGGLILLVWLYVLMVGLQPPATRAAVVATVSLLAPWLGRRVDSMTAVMVALAGIALVNPWSVRQAGFWLSASASVALCSTMAGAVPDGWRGKVWSVVKASVAASLATLPFVVTTFHSWSPMSIIANVMIAPVVDISFLLAYPYTVVAVVWPALASWIGWLPGVLIGFVLAVVREVAAVSPTAEFGDAGLAGAVVVAIPAWGLVALMSADVRRWVRIVRGVWLAAGQDGPSR